MSLTRTSHGPRIATVAACFVLGACTMVGEVPTAPVAPASRGPAPATPPPTGHPASTAELSQYDADHAEVAAQVVDIALSSIGTPYAWGGTDANGFDCSGLIQFAYSELGIDLPRTSAAQIRAGSGVTPRAERLRPGDILGFSRGGGPKTEHVGLYIGNDDFIHSSSTGVRISSLRNGYWRERLVAARRVVD